MKVGQWREKFFFTTNKSLYPCDCSRWHQGVFCAGEEPCDSLMARKGVPLWHLAPVGPRWPVGATGVVTRVGQAFGPGATWANVARTLAKPTGGCESATLRVRFQPITLITFDVPALTRIGGKNESQSRRVAIMASPPWRADAIQPRCGGTRWGWCRGRNRQPPVGGTIESCCRPGAAPALCPAGTPRGFRARRAS